MQDKEFGQKKKSPCSIKNVPVPEFVACTRCGAEVELWTDEEETACPFCRQKVFKKQSIIH